MSLLLALTVFALVFPAELPDKTLMATLVLATRYRPLPVWLGACAAFAVQCLIAVTAGRLLGLLPHRVVLVVAAALFAVGALVLARTDDDTDDVVESRPTNALHIAGTTFVVLFAAEWGDASQLLTAGLTARYDDPVSVFVGAFLALATVAGLAAAMGRSLVRVVPLRLVRRAAAVLFAALAFVTLVEAIRG
jgi:putative Ca2+/H+ antiporter (TMEM165/GDT1 family)